jgi:hypothetical protein
MRPLPGTVHEQRVRCGKANCRCARGEPHTAYYRFWREGGRLRKAYVPRRDLEATREACAEYRRVTAGIAAMIKGPAGDAQRRQIRSTLREALGDSPGAERIVRRWR